MFEHNYVVLLCGTWRFILRKLFLGSFVNTPTILEKIGEKKLKNYISHTRVLMSRNFWEAHLEQKIGRFMGIFP